MYSLVLTSHVRGSKLKLVPQPWDLTGFLTLIKFPNRRNNKYFCGGLLSLKNPKHQANEDFKTVSQLSEFSARTQEMV